MEEKLKEFLVEVGLAVSQRCFKAFKSDIDLNSRVKTTPADIIYRVDIEAEEEIEVLMEEKAAQFGGIILMAEGIGENDESAYPRGVDPQSAAIKIICDPIDGSRGLMYGKRAAFFLAAAGPASAENLSDMSVSVMVEIPIPKQGKFDVISAIRGKGVEYERVDSSGSLNPVELASSTATEIAGGFISFVKYCYPGKDYVAQIEELFLDRIFGDMKESFLPVFEDQYISNGGQLYELLCGHDLFIVDFRAAMYDKFAREGRKVGQISHPYDMAGVLTAQEAGIIVTNLDGTPFDAPLNMTYNVDWIGYANESIREQCEPIIHEILKKEGLV